MLSATQRGVEATAPRNSVTARGSTHSVGHHPSGGRPPTCYISGRLLPVGERRMDSGKERIGGEHAWERVEVSHDVVVRNGDVCIPQIDPSLGREADISGRDTVLAHLVEGSHANKEPAGIDFGDAGNTQGILLEVDAEGSRGSWRERTNRLVRD